MVNEQKNVARVDSPSDSSDSPTASANGATPAPAHTPAPWRVDPDARGFLCIRPGDTGWLLAQVSTRVNSPDPRHGDPAVHAYANARLIAAAPNLLAALKAVVSDDAGGVWRNLTGENAQRALAAIAKAEGR